MSRLPALLAIVCARCGNLETIRPDEEPEVVLEDLMKNYGYFMPSDTGWTDNYGDLVCCKSCHTDYVELYDTGEVS